MESCTAFPAWFCCGMEHWHKSVGELPGNFTQWNEHKTPQFEPMQRGKANLVVKPLAETEHGRQGTSVNLQGIPGFLTALSPPEHPQGSWSSAASINGLCLRIERNKLSHYSSDEVSLLFAGMLWYLFYLKKKKFHLMFCTSKIFTKSNHTCQIFFFLFIKMRILPYWSSMRHQTLDASWPLENYFILRSTAFWHDRKQQHWNDVSDSINRIKYSKYALYSEHLFLPSWSQQIYWLRKSYWNSVKALFPGFLFSAFLNFCH